MNLQAGTESQIAEIALKRTRNHTFLHSLIEFWGHFKKNRSAVGGLCILIVFALIAIFADQLVPYDPYTITVDRFLPPSAAHWFGTDDMGRDILSRVIYGSRITVTIGFYVAGMSITIGIIIGSISGFYGGRVDAVLMRLVEMVQMLPILVVAIVILLILGSGMLQLVFVLGLLGWTRTARVVRAEFLSLREREFVEAARAIGFPNYYIIFSEILPNVLPSIMVILSINVAAAILAEAGLSFLGLGVPGIITWGQMVQAAQQWLTRAWWISVFPGSAIFLAVLSFNLVGDGITDAINPYLKER